MTPYSRQQKNNKSYEVITIVKVIIIPVAT